MPCLSAAARGRPQHQSRAALAKFWIATLYVTSQRCSQSTHASPGLHKRSSGKQSFMQCRSAAVRALQQVRGFAVDRRHQASVHLAPSKRDSRGGAGCMLRANGCAGWVPRRVMGCGSIEPASPCGVPACPWSGCSENLAKSMAPVPSSYFMAIASSQAFTATDRGCLDERSDLQGPIGMQVEHNCLAEVH